VKRIAFLRNAWRTLFGAAFGVALVWAAIQPTVELDAVLRDLTSTDSHVRGNALFDLLAMGRWDGQTPEAIATVLRVHSEQAERVKTALIQSLERQGEYMEIARHSDLTVTEEESEVWANLVWAVSSLRDPRAIKGLVLAIDTGGMATGGLADLGPAAVDATIERLNDADPSVRTSAIEVLGGFLTRLEAVRSNPGAKAKAKAAIIAALDDPGPWVRRAAAGALAGLKNDTEVVQRLQSMTISDPETSTDRAGTRRYPLREAAARVLSMREVDLYYVLRAPDGRTCHIEKGADSAAPIALFGPLETPEIAMQVMCGHIDDTRKDPSLCWSVQPKNACRQ
jgi:hypothetical protein